MPAPSPTARKLIQKLTPLLSTPTNQSSSTFSEKQQTIASWMIFNRKKKEALAEGMSVAIRDSLSIDEDQNNRRDRLLLLLKIVHRALITNCVGLGESGADGSIWEKSEALRQTLVDQVVFSLLTELAGCLGPGDSCITQVEDIMKTWEAQNVSDGVVWGDLRQKWEDGLQKNDTGSSSTTTAVKEDAADEPAENAESAVTKIAVEDEKKTGTKNESAGVPSATDQPMVQFERDQDAASPDDRRRQFARQGSSMSITSVASVADIDYEGVEEAHVEPHRFLEAAKVVAQLQIARDIGGDTAMNLSSVFGHISPEIEELCKTMKQQNEADEDDASKEKRSKMLTKLPDDFLDLDLKYAKQSLLTYSNAIRQQKRARAQCLHLLLQSRCSFGSMEAARIIFGENKMDSSADDTPNIDDILEKLKRRKEELTDALALEGLDVEEDAEEEKKLEKEEKVIVPFSWFLEEGENVEEETVPTSVSAHSIDEPATKKLKSA